MKKMSFLFAGFLFLAVFASCTLQNQNSSVSFCFPSDTSEHLAAYRSTISGLQLSEQEPGGDDPVVKYYVDFVVNGETSSDFHKEFDSEEEINGYKLEINNLKAGTIATVGVEVGYGERAFFRGQSDILLHAGDNSAVIKLKAAEELPPFTILGYFTVYEKYRSNMAIPLREDSDFTVIFEDTDYQYASTAKWSFNGHLIEGRSFTLSNSVFRSYLRNGINTIECTVHHPIFENFKRTEKLVFTIAGELEVGADGIIPDYTIKSSTSYRSSGTGTFTLVTEDGKSFSNGTTYNWYLNNHLLNSSDPGVSIEGTKCSVELSKYDYTDESNTILCIAKYDGKCRSYSTTFDILDYEHSVLYYNLFSGASTFNWGRVPHNTKTGSDTAPTPTTPSGLSSSNTNLMAYCYDPDGDLYVSIKDESVNKIEKYPYNKSEQAYTDEKTTLWGASTRTPVRIATDGNYVYFVSATDSYKLFSTDNVFVYYVSAKNSSDITKITLNEDFSSITAVGVWAGKLYVGGKSANNTTLETKFKVGIGGACTSETVTVYTYKVMSYDIKPDGTIDTATKEQYVSYSEGALVKTLDLDDLGSTNPVEVSRPWADKVVKAGFVISDIVADYDNVYVLFSYNASNEYNVYGNSEGAEGQNPISSIGGFISYIENGSKKTITITGDIPSSLPYNESVKYYAPTRILAVKPKELIIADGNGDRNALFETVSLENKSVTVNRYGYGYQFDGAVNTSIEQFYNVETHEIDYINSDLSGTERQ